MFCRFSAKKGKKSPRTVKVQGQKLVSAEGKGGNRRRYPTDADQAADSSELTKV